MAAKPVQHAHTGEARLADLCGADEVDAAVRAADSTGTAWDLGFRGTTIIVNGGTSGPGAGTAQGTA